MPTLTHLLGRAPGLHRSPGAGTCYCLRDCLHDGRTVQVPAEWIAVTVSAWLAELGATSPLVQELACAVRSGDWPNAHALAECLSVEVAVAV
ncbi:hypothetical protein CIW52_28135 [Mycolicibacterium sp. P9-64]|uniref:hypothetical protein n=1 Tax=Mycolicibacterium sp. P9-64 TaxID=2024612 RepID=UPI0011EBC8C4|nr:hypothetical protein [Mycolicibacterium sp. P9-64]KAA0079526.1 hypothetical protein CIW52_28135 [Mycolicibacterium sp. P9-64]